MRRAVIGNDKKNVYGIHWKKSEMKRRGTETEGRQLFVSPQRAHSEPIRSRVLPQCTLLVINMIFIARNYAIEIFELSVSGSTPGGFLPASMARRIAQIWRRSPSSVYWKRLHLSEKSETHPFYFILFDMQFLSMRAPASSYGLYGSTGATNWFIWV